MRASQSKRTKSRRGAPWTLKELKQLGKVPDSVLARRTGRTIKEVVAMREHRRIGLRTPPRRWTAREIRLLGRYYDAEVSRRLRRDPHDVRAGSDSVLTFHHYAAGRAARGLVLKRNCSVPRQIRKSPALWAAPIWRYKPHGESSAFVVLPTAGLTLRPSTSSWEPCPTRNSPEKSDAPP